MHSDQLNNYRKSSMKAALNAIKKNSPKLEYDEDEITAAEQTVMDTKEYKKETTKSERVDKAIDRAKERLRIKNLQPKRQNIITLADKR
jgi:hypothetical protein